VRGSILGRGRLEGDPAVQQGCSILAQRHETTRPSKIWLKKSLFMSVLLEVSQESMPPAPVKPEE
jgi:hypothetical protein